MSYFSNQLRRLLDEGHKQNELADAADIPQGQFSKYVNGVNRPDKKSLNKLCKILTERDRAEIVMAHLRDEMPDCSRDLVAIVPKLSGDTARVREEPDVPLPPLVREAFDYFERAAQSDQDVADWIVSAYKITR